MSAKGRFILIPRLRTNFTTGPSAAYLRTKYAVFASSCGKGIAEEGALKKGMEAKSKEFVEKGAEVYAKA